ncbi:penicillopepsin [Zalerion maritima]|uniref:Penicillopepsin n=1 Tax=Zalerion maritima TaxID=339359 RepID=A0AAD5RSI9_9PEZI|nr:penicillopepsin [Zalerion maritima]
MQSIVRALLFCGLLAPFVAAAPQKLQKRGVFKVERVKNEKFTGRSGPKALIKAYRKFGMPLPQGLLDAMGNSGTSSVQSVSIQETNITVPAAGINETATPGTGLVTATPEANDVEYLAPVNIGGQTINLDFDSGSSDLWVFNTQLDAASTTGHQVYDPSLSQSFQLMQDQSWTIQYGDGSGAAGNVGTDVVDIGGATVTAQAVELATAVSQSFVDDTANNGLLGLAFSSINTVQPQQQKTFFDNVMPDLAEPLFTADLRANAVGAYEFGRIDNTKFTGDMTWIPVNNTQGFWQFSTDTFAVGADGASQPGAAGGQAIADTGTTLLLTSAEVVSGYYQQVPGAANNAEVGGVTFPCDSDLPDLMLDVSGMYMAKIKGSDINFAAIDNTGTECFGGVQSSPVNLQIWGDIFFKSQFVAFNGGNNTLGMAEHAV